MRELDKLFGLCDMGTLMPGGRYERRRAASGRNQKSTGRVSFDIDAATTKHPALAYGHNQKGNQSSSNCDGLHLHWRSTVDPQ
jgi:hypothetical protein